MKSVGRSDRSWSDWGLQALSAWALLALIVAGACWSGLRAVHAQVDETLLGLGSRALSFPGAPGEEPRTIEVNGVRVSLRTQVLEAPLEDVLSYYEGVCGGTDADAPKGRLLASLATRARRTSRDGYVACVELVSHDIPSLVRRASRFARSWNLADIGFPRYAYARRADDRHPGLTHVVTMWSDESLDLRRLLPRGQGDAPGEDPTGLERPARSQRLLSARELSDPSAVYVYRVKGSSAVELVDAQRRMLSGRGWRVIERHPGESIAIDGARLLSAEKHGRLATAIIHREQPESLFLTLLVSGWE
jgi:hypothetical protein